MFETLGWYWLAPVECRNFPTNHSTQLDAEQASKVHNREKGILYAQYDLVAVSPERYDQSFLMVWDAFGNVTMSQFFLLNLTFNALGVWNEVPCQICMKGMAIEQDLSLIGLLMNWTKMDKQTKEDENWMKTDKDG